MEAVAKEAVRLADRPLEDLFWIVMFMAVVYAIKTSIDLWKSRELAGDKRKGESNKQIAEWMGAQKTLVTEQNHLLQQIINDRAEHAAQGREMHARTLNAMGDYHLRTNNSIVLLQEHIDTHTKSYEKMVELALKGKAG